MPAETKSKLPLAFGCLAEFVPKPLADKNDSEMVFLSLYSDLFLTSCHFVIVGVRCEWQRR